MEAIARESPGKEICLALGLDPLGIRGIDISLKAGDVARVIIDRLLDSAEDEQIAKILEEYELIKKEVN